MDGKSMEVEQQRKVAVRTTTEGPDWGAHPPRRLRKAKSIWNHMKHSGRGVAIDGKGAGDWYTAEMIYVWYNENFRYDITPNWLSNVLAKNKGAFEKGPDRRFWSHGGGKRVAIWRAV